VELGNLRRRSRFFLPIRLRRLWQGGRYSLNADSCAIVAQHPALGLFELVQLLADSPKMDATYASGLSRFAGSLLALAGACCSAVADDAVVVVDDAPSMLVVTATDAGAALQQPPAVAAAEIIVHDDAVVPATTSGNEKRSTQGDLSVVANTQLKKTLTSVVFDPEVVPAANSKNGRRGQQRGSAWSDMFSGGPLRPNVATGIQSRHNSRLQDQAIPSQLSAGPRVQPKVKSAESRLAPPARKPANTASSAARRALSPPSINRQQASSSKPNDPGSQLLVQAYELSLRASREEEFSQIVRCCAEAMRYGLEGENRQFALELSAWALNRRGQLRSDENQHDLALADFRAALDFDQNCWRALHNRGVTYAQNGQFAEAFDDFCKAIELNPKFAKAYSNRATLYVQAGDMEKALADYDAALKIDPALAAALVGRGRLYHLSGRLQDALASFNAAIEKDPEGAEIICSRGDLLVDLGRYNDALQDYARAIDLNPKFEHAYRNGAWLLATCPDDAVRDSEGALKGAQAALDCGYGERHAALDTLAAALANAGRYEEAVGTLQQAIEIAPEEARADYQARQQLYESRQPFRTRPIGQDVQTAVFVGDQD
jgi:tetratricopeptide (TPR) repeat protein